MKRNKRSKLGRRGKIGLTVLIAAMFIGVASAAVLTHYGQITTTVNANQTIRVDGEQFPVSGNLIDKITEESPGGETFCFFHWLENKGSIPIAIELKPGCTGKTFEGGGLNCDGITTTYLKGMKGGIVSVESIDTNGMDPEDAFNAEPETLVLDDMPFDAQTDPVTIEGKLSGLDLGDNWVDTAYVEIGVRPAATKDKENRNAGVYLIAFNAADETWIHLQDYTEQNPGDPNIIKIGKNSDFSYEITLTPDGSIGGTATLEVWVVGVSQGTVSLDYGWTSDWQGQVDKTESFTEAHLFYSIIADRRGTAKITYSATVGDIKTNSELLKSPATITIPSGAKLYFFICHSIVEKIYPGTYIITTTIA